jgi:hypothetical protein
MDTAAASGSCHATQDSHLFITCLTTMVIRVIIVLNRISPPQAEGGRPALATSLCVGKDATGALMWM